MAPRDSALKVPLLPLPPSPFFSIIAWAAPIPYLDYVSESRWGVVQL